VCVFGCLNVCVAGHLQLSLYLSQVFFAAYNVTEALQAADRHAIGVTLGNGWFNLLPLRMWGR
jgi:hypothetical protein